MEELNIQETIEDLKTTIDKLKEQLVYIVNEDLNEYIKFRIKYYQNIIDWLERYQEMCSIYENDLK